MRIWVLQSFWFFFHNHEIIQRGTDCRSFDGWIHPYKVYKEGAD